METDLEDSAGLNKSPSPTITVEKLDSSTEDETANLSNLLSFVDKNRTASQIQVGRSSKKGRLSAEDHFQNVQDIEIELQDSSESKYSPGDIAVIFPKNSQSKIDFMLDYFSLKPDQVVQITLRDKNYTLTAQNLFGYVLKLSEAPKFYFFKMLRFFAEEKIYKDKIKDMSKFKTPQ